MSGQTRNGLRIDRHGVCLSSDIRCMLLTSRKFNIHQVMLAAIVSYMAFRLISLLFLNNPDTPPE